MAVGKDNGASIQLPLGVVTFLMTDVGGSTALWERDPAGMARAMARHDQLAAEAIEGARGFVLKQRGEGDSVFAVFERARDAVAAAGELQESLDDDPVIGDYPIEVRVAIHSSDDYKLEPGDYRGNGPNRCARLRACAHPGQTLLTQAAWALAADDLPEGAEGRALGSHVLRDLSLPEQVYQLVLAGRRNDFPPILSLNNHPNNLPVQLTTFVGRTEEIGEVQRKLAASRMLTLKGPGGCGKTRLALQVAAEILDDYADGTWLVDLGAVPRGETVGDRFAEALGATGSRTKTALEELAVTIGPRRILLVVDRCEHVATDCAQVMAKLLRQCPHLAVLATSRRQVGVPGEVVYTVPPLKLPSPSRALPTDWLSYDAVRLFVERARARDDGFSPSAANATDILGICATLDGLPLGIEVAAAHIAVLTPRQMREHIGLAMQAIEDGTAERGEGQASLRAALQWSYDLLSDDARSLLPRLTIFPRGWTFEGALSVCCEDGSHSPRLYGALDELVRHSLVSVDSPPNGSRRFRLLETTKQFASELLKDDAIIRRRLYDYLVSLAEAADPQLLGPEQTQWFAQLDSEYENLLAALGWGFDWRESTVPSFALALRTYWLMRGKLAEGRQWCGRCLSLSDLPGLTRARLLNATGAFCQRQSDFPAALEALTEALSLFRAHGTPIEVAKTLVNLGGVAARMEEPDRAQRHFAEARRILEQQGEDRLLAFALLNMAVLAIERGRHDAAVQQILEQTVAVAHRVGNQAVEAVAHGNLAEVFLLRNQLPDAARALRQAFSFWEHMPDPSEVACALIDLAVLCSREAMPDAVVQLIRASDGVAAGASLKLPPRQRVVRDALADELRVQPSAAEPEGDVASVALMALGQLDQVEAKMDAEAPIRTAEL